MTVAYYNEIDPYAAQWLRNLILRGHLPRSDVDARSISELHSDDLQGFTQCHFFAGIGGWAIALRMACWPDDRPVWTGSCPCQPFSSAGKQEGNADERHLWPIWFRLIRECKPPTVFGAQVASAIAHEWLDETAHDLESEGYAFAAAVLPGCSVGAPHRRDRLWFVADTAGQQVGTARQPRQCQHVAHSPQQLLNRGGLTGESRGNESTNGHDVGGTCCTELEIQMLPDASSENGGYERPRIVPESHRGWEGEWLLCPDGKSRPVKPGIRLLANGVPARVGRLRAYGNAVVPQVAAEVISAFMECKP